MSEEVLNDLTSLDKEDLQRVQRLINKLLGKKDNKPKRSRKKVRSKESKQPEQQPEQNQAPQITKRVKKRSKRKKEKYEQDERRGCRTESMNMSGDRPNTFLDMGFEKMHKKDVRIDKLLSGDNQVTPRGRVSLIKVDCQICGNEYDVPPSVVYQEGGDLIFTCDKCQRKG